MTRPDTTVVEFFETSEVEAKVRLSPEEHGVLDEVNQQVATGRSVEEVMDYLFDSTRSVFPCDRLGLAILEEDGRLVTQWAKADYSDLRLGRGYAEDVRGGSLERVIESGQPRIISSLPEYLRQHPESHSTRLLVDEGVQSSLTCPLVVGDRRIGMLFRSSRKPSSYDIRQVGLHLAVANRLAQAVEKVYLIEQLQRANKAYMEMLAFVSHEFKNPLASIIMTASVLTEGHAGSLDEDARERVEQMAKKASFLTHLVKEYLDLARIEDEGMTLDLEERVDIVSKVLEPSVDLLLAQVEQQRMRIEWDLPPKPPRMTFDPDLMKIVAVNLIGNALKYGQIGGLIRISLRRKPKNVRVAVWNEGPGFPKSERPRLFRRFSRLQTPELQARKGTGIGLYTSWKIVRQHGGRMDARSKEGEWAEFGFSLPLADQDQG